MPASPFERDVDPRRSADRVSEPWSDPAAGPERRAAPPEQPAAVRADETPEEPGYGHGV